MKITLYDGNNWFRRRIESDITGRVISNCFYEVQNSPSFPIVIWDGYGALKSRREIFPDYKVSRNPAGESIYASQNTLAEVLKFGKGLSIKLDGFEADDVIAYFARKRIAEGHEVFIDSNDADLSQLGCKMARKEFPIPPHWITLYKTLVGDPSDNIKGVKGFGKGTWEKLTNDNMLLLQAIVCSYVNESEERVLEHLTTLPLPKSAINWMKNKENRQLLTKYYKIVNFMPVTEAQINGAVTTNVNQPHLAQPIFEEFMI